jgi:hypothetical protein
MAWSKVMNQDQGDVLEAYQVRLFSRTRNPVTQKFHSHGNFFPLRTTCLSFENHPILLLQQNRTKVEMHAILCWRGLAVRQNLVEIMLTPTVANERIRVIHPLVRRQVSALRRLKARVHAGSHEKKTVRWTSRTMAAWLASTGCYANFYVAKEDLPSVFLDAKRLSFLFIYIKN